MKTLSIKKLLLLTLIGYTFSACIKHEQMASTDAMETVTTSEKDILNEEILTKRTIDTGDTTYGQHTNEIEEFLSATPLGSEIYLEQKENGEWYLKIEKTFTAKKHEEKTEVTEPIYGESILI